MSFGVFPSEMVFLFSWILGDEAHLNQKSFQAAATTPEDKITRVTASEGLKAPRLTSKRISQIATTEIFRHFHDDSDKNSAVIFQRLTCAQPSSFAQNFRHLTLERCKYEGIRDVGRPFRRRSHPFSFAQEPDFMCDLSLFPRLETIRTKEWELVNVRKERIRVGQYFLHLAEWLDGSRLFYSDPDSNISKPRLVFRVSDLGGRSEKIPHANSPGLFESKYSAAPME